MRAKMTELVQDNSELLQALMNRAALQKKYDEARERQRN